MDDVRQALEQLGEPDLEAVDRIYARYKTTRALEPRRRRRRIAGGAVALAAAVTLTTLWATSEEAPRSLEVASPVTPVAHQWGSNVQFEAVGQGTLEGTDSEAVLAWTTGTVEVEVTPQTDTQLSVVTEEARVDVIGTVFQVRRDALGSTVGVDRGKVQVACTEGQTLELTAGMRHTCLPVTAAGLLGRADALIDAGRHDELLDTLDRGIGLGSGPVKGELLVRRMQHNSRSGAVDAVLSDATEYLANDSGRLVEVQRMAAYTAAKRGCSEALPWLEQLQVGGSAADLVFLGECLVNVDPDRAHAVLTRALPALDGDLAIRAANALAAAEAKR